MKNEVVEEPTMAKFVYALRIGLGYVVASTVMPSAYRRGRGPKITFPGWRGKGSEV